MLVSAAHIMFPESLDSLEPIEIEDGLSHIKAAFVGRYAIDQIPQHWRKIGLCGIYVLLSDVRGEQGAFDVYVGYTKTGFERRLFDHDGTKNYWQQAILFARLDGQSMSSTQAQWLEGRIVDLLKAGRHVRVHNARYTGDETLPAYELPEVEQISLFVMRVLFLRGYRSASLGDEVSRLERSVDRRGFVPPAQPAILENVPAAPVLPEPPTVPTIYEPILEPAQEAAQPAVTAPTVKAAAKYPQRVPHIVTSSNPAADLVHGNMWETLRKWRWRVKEEAKLYKAYHVFTDAELAGAMTARPTTLAELAALPGFSENKISRFGDSLLATLNAFYETEAGEPEPVIVQESVRHWWQR